MFHYCNLSNLFISLVHLGKYYTFVIQTSYIYLLIVAKNSVSIWCDVIQVWFHRYNYILWCPFILQLVWKEQLHLMLVVYVTVIVQKELDLYERFILKKSLAKWFRSYQIQYVIMALIWNWFSTFSSTVQRYTLLIHTIFRNIDCKLLDIPILTHGLLFVKPL